MRRAPVSWEPGWTIREETLLKSELGERVMEYVLNENYRRPYRQIPWPGIGKCRWYLVTSRPREKKS